ncbi:MAG: nicotinate-nucleotide--dimethylbenzimidazole phosphoribosyltransferase [Treponema sp.]|nr:nicotinate-nucleotide--dimethylbenzimidazole phosphoribosyltransferase [Treponema sp.]
MAAQSLDEFVSRIEAADGAFFLRAQKRWDCIAKPLHGLGLLEDAVCRIAAVQRTERPCFEKRALAVFCADNGIVAENVSQTDAHVTAVVAKNLCTGDASVCKMARVAGCDVFPVDMGMCEAVTHPRLFDAHVARGTKDFFVEDAMSRVEAEESILRGAAFAERLACEGYALLATGEMGIGNTTTSSAMASVLLGVSPELVTGTGAGLSAEGVAHKIRVIKEGIERRKPRGDDAIDVLSKLGGFDIGGMAGFMLGAAANRISVVIDGVISQVAALTAVRLCPLVRDYLLASHRGSEKASGLLLDALGHCAVVNAEMHLGEGTGAMTVLPLLDMALSVYNEMATFDDIQISAYKPL